MDWSMIISVVTINVLLSSDNALAIAMASRRLDPAYRKKAVFLGSISAISLQIVLTYLASYLLSILYLKIVGGAVLAWIASKMIVNEDCAETQDDQANPRCFWAAIRAIAIANLIMSLDNVLAVAAVAEGNIWALGLGILVSFPLIMWGSVFISNLLERYPFLVWMGAVFLGWTAGEIISSDIFITGILNHYGITHTSVSAIFAIGVSFLAWHEAVNKIRVLDR